MSRTECVWKATSSLIFDISLAEISQTDLKTDIKYAHFRVGFLYLGLGITRWTIQLLKPYHTTCQSPGIKKN